MNYQLKTSIEGSRIVHDLSLEDLNKASMLVSKWICDTREQHTREVLIKLGWTPPDGRLSKIRKLVAHWEDQVRRWELAAADAKTGEEDVRIRCDVRGYEIDRCRRQLLEILDGEDREVVP